MLLPKLGQELLDKYYIEPFSKEKSWADLQPFIGDKLPPRNEKEEDYKKQIKDGPY